MCLVCVIYCLLHKYRPYLTAGTNLNRQVHKSEERSHTKAALFLSFREYLYFYVRFLLSVETFQWIITI